MIELLEKKYKEENIFDLTIELEIKSYNKIWALDFLYDQFPFFQEINKFKRGNIFKNEPKKKDNKFCNFYDKQNNIIGAYNYIANWDEPNQYILIKCEKNLKFIFVFGITKKLERVVLQEYEQNKLKSIYHLDSDEQFTIINLNYENESNIYPNKLDQIFGYDINNQNDNIKNETYIKYFLDNKDLKLYQGESISLIYEGINPYYKNESISPFRNILSDSD